MRHTRRSADPLSTLQSVPPNCKLKLGQIRPSPGCTTFQPFRKIHNAAERKLRRLRIAIRFGIGIPPNNSSMQSAAVPVGLSESKQADTAICRNRRPQDLASASVESTNLPMAVAFEKIPSCVPTWWRRYVISVCAAAPLRMQGVHALMTAERFPCMHVNATQRSLTCRWP